MRGKRPPLDEEKSLFEATVAVEGVTTSAGEGTGLSLVDAGLAGSGANSYVSMMAVIHPGDPTQVDSRDITAFTDGDGTVRVASAFKGGQVAAGVHYKIVTFRFVPAEVAALAADLGDMADAATNDNMSDIETTSALAKLRLILNRLSPDAFSATIHAGARTSLDTMLAEMAKYFVADGGGFDLKINNGVNRDNLNLIMRDFFTVIGILNTSIWQPTIGGSTQVTVVAAIQALANYWAPLGDGLDIKINNGVNRDDLKNILKDFFTMIGCLDTNVFNPTIGGSARTTFDDAWTAMATYFATGGAAIASTVDPGGTERATLELILEDLGKILAGGGITTYPAAASPGNAVNMAAVLRAIVNSLTGSDTYTDYTKINNIASTSLDGALQALAGVFAAAGTDEFGPTILGSTRTNMELALFALASYFVSAGGAYSIKVNNQDLRTNLEAILQDFFAVVGCDGTNAFNPSVGGTERSTIEAAFAALSTMLDGLAGAAGIFHEQADVPLSFDTVNGSETDVFNLVVADTRYIIRSLRLKFATPGANTITVKLYELVNDGLVVVDTFEVTSANFGTYHSLMDMFGLPQLAGDNLKVTTQVSAGGDIATLGQYSFAKTNV